MATLKVKRLNPDAFLPTRATSGSAGLDLTANESVTIYPHQTVKVRTGLAFEVPPGFEAQIRPRSGVVANHGVTVANAPGTIDSDYRGEVCVLLVNHSAYPFDVEAGARIAQVVVAPVEMCTVEEVDEVTDTSRGDGGFGSTGR